MENLDLSEETSFIPRPSRSQSCVDFLDNGGKQGGIIEILAVRRCLAYFDDRRIMVVERKKFG